MGRGRQIVRQWKLLRALQAARGGVPVSDLHVVLDGEGDVSVRTVYRDLEQLVKAGFPVVERDGRWRALEQGEGGWAVPIEPTELLALSLAEEVMAPLRGSWLEGPLRSVRTKLAALLTPVGRRYLDDLRGAAVATLFGPGDFMGGAGGTPGALARKSIRPACRIGCNGE